MKPFNWTCPYCNRAQTVTEDQYSSYFQPIWNDKSTLGSVGLYVTSTRCANSDCSQLSLSLAMYRRQIGSSEPNLNGLLYTWQLLPESSAKPQPSFIPEPIVQDYVEACRIRDLSPKASATLSRRCLQGMIRDFCGISKKRLVDEINTLRNKVHEGKGPPGVMADTMDAIDHVRSIGNIGAHMEADINVLVDVDPGEAQQLIELLELLLDEWYVQRESRLEKLRKLGVVANEKKQARLAAPAKQLEGPKSESDSTK